MSLLRHYYVNFMSLLQMAKLCDNDLVINHYYIGCFYYDHIIYYPLFSIIT